MAEINFEKMVRNVAEAALDNYEYQGKTIREWINIIAEQNQKFGEWTPVSERLPEPQDDGDEDYSTTVQVTVHVCRDTYIVRNAFYCFSEDKWYTEGLCVGRVTAWMPLPDPYKEEGEQK